MKKRIWFWSVLLFAVFSLSACEEGKQLNPVETGQKTENTDTSINKNDNNDETIQQDLLQIQNKGGAYHVDSWKLYDSMAEADISADSLSDYGIMLSETGKDFKFMLATISRNSTADCEGDFPEAVNVNIFFPVMQKSLDAAYLPEAEPGTVNRMNLEHGYEPVYLDVGKIGANNYFEISVPPEGESITYTLGFFLSEEEYRAGENGELYFWYSMDEAQTTEDLQLLHLSPESLQ